MTPQQSVWIITLIFIGIIALVFLFAITGGGRPGRATPEQETVAEHRWELFRVGAFSILAIALLFVTFFTLVRFPIPFQDGVMHAAKVVNVTGRQWSWQLSSDTVPVGKPIEFAVTSDDVNHDFAIYDENEDLVAQTQAMPEFTNRLLYTFQKTGTYHVLCLEYCGVGHPTMRTEIHVVAAAQGETK